MRVCPIAIAFHDNLEEAMDIAEKTSYLTHDGKGIIYLFI